MPGAEQYLKPEVIRTVSRLDLRARFIVEGFLSGLHASPYHGFSVEFSEHRRYSQGDDPKDIDWLVYAKTDRYYVKKYEAETNITGYLLMDLSESMAYTYQQELTKFDYSICLAAALAYLMIHQQDPVGVMTLLLSAAPGTGKSLWRSNQNTIRLTFNRDIATPGAGQVKIREMLAGGSFGTDLSSGFSFTIENDGFGNPPMISAAASAPVSTSGRSHGGSSPAVVISSARSRSRFRSMRGVRCSPDAT